MILLKEWKWVGRVLGAWNLNEILQTLSGFVTQLFIDLNAKL